MSQIVSRDDNTTRDDTTDDGSTPVGAGDVPVGTADVPVADAASLLERVPVAVASVAADGRVLSMSEGVRRVTGFAPQVYLGHPWPELTHPDDLERIDVVLEELRDAGTGTHRTLSVRTASAQGPWLAVVVDVACHLDEPGIEAYVVSMRPLVDPAASPDAHEAFLSSALDVAADALLVVDEEFHIRWASASATRFSGWTPEELLSMGASDLVHPDDVDRLLRVARMLMGAEDGEPEAVECRILRADGSWRWMRIGGADLRNVDGVRGVVVVVSDVHEAVEERLEREATERRFEAMVQHSHDGIIVSDRDGRCHYVSPAVTRILGWPPEVVRDAPFAAGVPEPDRTQLIEARRRASEDPRHSQVVQCRLPHADGGYRWIEMALRDRTDSPDVGGMICNYRDVTEQRELVAELQQRNEMLGSLAFSSTTGLFEQDSRDGLVRVNERWVEITGMSADDSLGDGWKRLISDRVGRPSLAEAPVGPEESVRIRIHRPDGEHRWVDLRSTILPPDPRGVVRRVGGIEDVTLMVEAETARGRLAGVFDATDDLVVLVGVDGAVLYTNRAATQVLGADLEHISEAADLADLPARVTDPSRPGAPARWGGEVNLTARDGQRVPVSLEVLAHSRDDGVVDYVSIVGRDISERIALELSLERQATHDPLTGLPNRTLLIERIRRAAGAPGASVALLFVDLDHFKVINDSLGHGLGDLLLQAIARRITTVVRPRDTVARFGGDEFVVLCEGVDSEDDVFQIAHRVEATLQAPFGVDGHDIHVGVSIGIAFADGDSDPETILRDADTAMYQAKSSGRGRWVVFDDDLRREVVARQQVESELRRCRDGTDLELHYQPVLDLASRAVRGVEALVRWRRDGVLVGPEEFVPVAEETGLIVPIGRWVLEQACRQAAEWQRLPGWSDLGIAVNVSARQLQRPGFATRVAEILTATGVAPGTLTLEITETVLIEDQASVVEVLGTLREMDVHVAVDDFGTGYSSLTYLHRLPVDTVKLDRSFVAGVSDDLQKQAIVTAVINLTKALGLQSIAEGVETERQLAELRMLGCTAGQGHLISAAVGPGEIRELLLSRP